MPWRSGWRKSRNGLSGMPVEPKRSRNSMTTAITVSPWLGIRKDPWAQEKFPKGTVNFKQLRTLLNMEDRGRVMVDLDLDPAILKITDEIVEVHTRFGQ